MNPLGVRRGTHTFADFLYGLVTRFWGFIVEDFTDINEFSTDLSIIA